MKLNLPVLQTCCYFAVQVHSDNWPKIPTNLYTHHTPCNRELRQNLLFHFSGGMDQFAKRIRLHLVCSLFVGTNFTGFSNLKFHKHYIPLSWNKQYRMSSWYKLALVVMRYRGGIFYFTKILFHWKNPVFS